MLLNDIITFAIIEKTFKAILDYLNANYLFAMAGINKTILLLTHCDLLLSNVREMFHMNPTYRGSGQRVSTR